MRRDSLCKTIMQGTIDGVHRRGRQRKSWSDNVKEWTGMTMPDILTQVADRPTWRNTSASSALRSPDEYPSQGTDDDDDDDEDDDDDDKQSYGKYTAAFDQICL